MLILSLVFGGYLTEQWEIRVHKLFVYRLRTYGSDLAYQIPFCNGIAITKKLLK